MLLYIGIYSLRLGKTTFIRVAEKGHSKLAFFLSDFQTNDFHYRLGAVCINSKKMTRRCLEIVTFNTTTEYIYLCLLGTCC